MGVNGAAAAEKLRSFRNITRGMCLYYVWQAYKAVGASTGMSSPTAYDSWGKSQGHHDGDTNPPVGVPVFFGPRAGSSAGDVVISVGNGRVVATDYPTWGQVGECTIDERARQTARPYLGWAERLFDVAIDYAYPAAPAPAPAPSAPAPASPSYPVLTLDNLFTAIPDCRGLQKIAKKYGYAGPLDNIPGAGTKGGFQNFLNRNYGGSALNWLRGRWGYVGDDRLGPVMTAAIQRANDENWRAL